MKVLISAFACQPNKGSEYGRGWGWATELAKIGHQVWVITWSHTRSQIEQELEANLIPNLHFVYCDKATWVPKAYKFVRAIRIPLGPGIVWNLSCTWWQWDAYQLAKSLHKEIAFDLVHHVTNTTIRRGSFMGLLNIPFILGPLAGGVKTPWSLRKGFSFKGKFIELIRDLNNSLVKFDPLMHLTFAKAEKIYCDSRQTQKLIPKLYRSRSKVVFSMPTPQIIGNIYEIEQNTIEEIFRVLFVGRFLHWKGIHLGLIAFARLHQKIPGSRFTIIGTGSERNRLQKLTKQLGIEEVVDWIPWMEQKKLSSVYFQHDVFLFPSLHDMGGNVVLESLHHGLPVVCLDIGGPGVMVDETSGRVIKTDKLEEEAVIERLSNALIELAENSERRQQLSTGASARPSEFAFKDVVKNIYVEASQLVNCPKC